jgi:hypothetical protein
VNSTVVYLASSGTPSWFVSASTIHSAQAPLAGTTPGALAAKAWPTPVVRLARKIDAVLDPGSRQISGPAGYAGHGMPIQL